MKKILVALILSQICLFAYADIPTPTREKEMLLNNFDIFFISSFIIVVIFPILLLLRKIRKK